MSARTEAEAQIEADLLAYIEDDHGMLPNDKLEKLRNIFRKHSLPLQSELVVTKKEFNLITSVAMAEYTKGMPEVKYLRRPLDHSETVNYALFKAFAGFLNSKNALLRVPQFKE